MITVNNGENPKNYVRRTFRGYQRTLDVTYRLEVGALGR